MKQILHMQMQWHTDMLTHIQQPLAPNTSCFIAHWHLLSFLSLSQFSSVLSEHTLSYTGQKTHTDKHTILPEFDFCCLAITMYSSS